MHPEHHSVSDGHDKAYNIPFHPVKRRKNCRRGQKLHSPVSAEIQVSDVSSRKQGPTGWHWRLLLAILHNNRESSYRWRNKKCILYLYSSAGRNEVLRSHGSDRLFCCHRDSPIDTPIHIQVWKSGLYQKKESTDFPSKRCKYIVSRCQFFVFAIRTKSCNAVRCVRKYSHELPSCYLCRSVCALS